MNDVERKLLRTVCQAVLRMQSLRAESRSHLADAVEEFDARICERGDAKEKGAEVSCTLTDEEREAVEWAAEAYERRYQERVGLENNGPDQCGEIAGTLRRLLDRLA